MALRIQGFSFGAGYSQEVSWLYDQRFATLPGVSASTPVLFGHYWGIQGPTGLLATSATITSEGNLFTQWVHDVSTPSFFSGTVTIAAGGATGTLTLSGPATGHMWEGEVVACTPFTVTCKLGNFTYITNLISGAWGASGSTYGLAEGNSLYPISAIASPITMTNGMYYTGSGGAFNIGPYLDENLTGGGSLGGIGGVNPHGWSGQQGMGRIGRRMAALTLGALTDPLHTTPDAPNASAPYVDRVVAHAPGCDSSATTAPCFDIGTTTPQRRRRRPSRARR